MKRKIKTTRKVLVLDGIFLMSQLFAFGLMSLPFIFARDQSVLEWQQINILYKILMPTFGFLFGLGLEYYARYRLSKE